MVCNPPPEQTTDLAVLAKIVAPQANAGPILYVARFEIGFKITW